jgi:MFS family permease
LIATNRPNIDVLTNQGNSVKPAIPQTVWILGFASLLTDVSSEMIHSVLPLFLVSLGAGASMIGLIDGVAEAIASSLKLFSGALSDYFGKRKPLLVAGYGLSTAVKPLFALATSPYMVLVARCLDRLGKGFRAAPRDALVADVTEPSQRGAAFGLRQSLDSVGAVIGPAAAFLTLTNNDFRQVFWLALVPAVLTVILLAVKIREPEKHAETGNRVNPLNIVSIKSLGRNFWLLFAVSLIFTMGNSSDAFILLRARQIGITLNLVPLALVIMNAVYAASSYPAGRLSDTLGRKNVLLGSFALYSLIYVGFALAAQQWHVWVLLAFYGLFMGMSQGVLLAVTADRVPPNLRGTAFGFMNLSIGIALLPANLLAGFLWEHLASWAAFAAGAGFSLAALILFSFDTAEQRVETEQT